MADTGFDQGNTLYLADSQRPEGLDARQLQNEWEIPKTLVENTFYKFLRDFRDADETFLYRDLLRTQYNSGNYVLNVDLTHLSIVNSDLVNEVRGRPADYLPLLEKAVLKAVDEMTRPRPNNAECKPMQVTLTDNSHPILIRDLDSLHISKLVRVPGIIINASTVRAKATQIYAQCRNCNHQKRIPIRAGFGGAVLPRSCENSERPLAMEDAVKCPLDPYQIIGDKCDMVDQQTLKLQENPEAVPTGELPRHVLLAVDRNLVNKVVAGTRVTAVGIYDIFGGNQGKSSNNNMGGASTRIPYIRVVGFMMHDDDMNVSSVSYTSEDEAKFLELARDPEIYNKIAAAISPSILGSIDIKKAIACLLFGGSRKQLPDGMRLRGDINVLLLGDPGTAKSQLLKYVEKMAPVAVYTSGKGSSAAGLTASVIRDSSSREFYLEAGAMVLADGGVACIDEFDKMRETDRVAIHEAMEQQTISIAKAGITTILNSRTSVLAAANSTFGRWDDTQDQGSNIDFQATVLSRFDTIFIVKDLHDEVQDSNIARHVIRFHQRSTGTVPDQSLSNSGTDVLQPELLKKYIHYARRTCGPRLHSNACERLINEFVTIRQGTKHSQSAIPITIRQLEAIIRISESIAKMRLAKFATIADVEEALRLFRCSTLEAATNGNLALSDELQGSEQSDATREVERRIQRRFFIGANVSKRVIIDDFIRQGYTEQTVNKAIWVMCQRGDLEHRYQRKVLHRVR